MYFFPVILALFQHKSAVPCINGSLSTLLIRP
uniref:Uncharacterized protein n=1 Tax=Anguilla anguilla TaxID=7936 RepID=A0A0E9R8W7_ANGAN